MLLASVPSIRKSLGFDDMTDINAAITSALHAAEAQIAALLSTSFGREQMVDKFWVYEPPFVQGSHTETKFRLSRGLISDVSSIMMSNAPTMFTNPDAQDISDRVTVDTQRGIATDVTTYYAEQYVEIRYTAGFDVDANDPESYNLDQVPAWLQQAATLKTLILVADAPALTEAGVKIDKQMLDQQYALTVNRYVRYAPTALLPM